MPDCLFVYGTLRPGLAPAEIADVVAKLKPLGDATVRGRLRDLGDYPGLVLDELGHDVPGVLLKLPPHCEPMLAKLDAYEGFYPASPDASLFRRVAAEVTREDGSTCACWIYEYNRPLS